MMITTKINIINKLFTTVGYIKAAKSAYNLPVDVANINGYPILRVDSLSAGHINKRIKEGDARKRVCSHSPVQLSASCASESARPNIGEGGWLGWWVGVYWTIVCSWNLRMIATDKAQIRPRPGGSVHHPQTHHLHRRWRSLSGSRVVAISLDGCGDCRT